jgi:hypothetical protein
MKSNTNQNITRAKSMKKQPTSIEQAIKELKTIIEERDDQGFKYAKTREGMLMNWIYRWVDTVEKQQLVLDQKYIDSEYSDFIKHRLTESMLEDVSEAAVEYTTSQNALKASISVFRRKPRQ